MNLTQVEKMPLSDDDILKILPDCRIIKYNEFRAFHSLNDVLKSDKDYLIFLYEQSRNSGHWNCILRYNNIFEIFDPYGIAPDRQLKWVPQHMRKLLNETEPWLTDLIDNTSNRVIHNSVKYQREDPDISTCGDHCCYRIYMYLNHGYNLDDYYKHMKQAKEKTKLSFDEIVALFVKANLSL